jgi:hypothetical protein
MLRQLKAAIDYGRKSAASAQDDSLRKKAKTKYRGPSLRSG